MIALSNHALSPVALRRVLGVTFLAMTAADAPVLILKSAAWSPASASGRVWSTYAAMSRLVSPWRDVVDRVLGLPFDVVRPEAGFASRTLRVRSGGHGCNGFVFERSDREA